jgi:hypothetical protein
MQIVFCDRARSFMGSRSILLTSFFEYNSSICGCGVILKNSVYCENIVVLSRKFLYSYCNRGDYAEIFNDSY